MDSTALAAARTENGARWLDLVATRVNWPSHAPLERLPDLDALRRWLERHALVPEAEPTAARKPETLKPHRASIVFNE